MSQPINISSNSYFTPSCEHPVAEVRYRIASNGVKHFPKQCVDCGAQVGIVTKNSLSAAKRMLLPAWDSGLQSRYYADLGEARRAEWAQKRADEQAAWWRAYSTYLESPEWRARRQLVLERDQCRCTARLHGCRGTAKQVHHLSYQHLFDEPLWELQSVCVWCHEVLTGRDRANRGQVGSGAA